MVDRESLKGRSIYVLPSDEMAHEWKDRAKRSNVSISQFVLEHVGNSLSLEEGEEGFRSRAQILQVLRSKNETIEKLGRENEVLTLALERVENELRRYHAEPFLDENFRGIRGYDRKLVEL